MYVFMIEKVVRRLFNNDSSRKISVSLRLEYTLSLKLDVRGLHTLASKLGARVYSIPNYTLAITYT